MDRDFREKKQHGRGTEGKGDVYAMKFYCTNTSNKKGANP